MVCRGHQIFLQNYTIYHIHFPSALSEACVSFNWIFLSFAELRPSVNDTHRLESIVQVVDNFLAGTFLTTTSAWYFQFLSPYYLSVSYYLVFIFKHFKIQPKRSYSCDFSCLVMYVWLLQIQNYYFTSKCIIKLIMLLEVSLFIPH